MDVFVKRAKNRQETSTAYMEPPLKGAWIWPFRDLTVCTLISNNIVQNHSALRVTYPFRLFVSSYVFDIGFIGQDLGI